MGSSSSVLYNLDNEEHKEEIKEQKFAYEIFEDNEDNEIQSAVWYSIHAVIKSILVIRTDFIKEKNTAILYEVLKKVMINIDSIYNICDTTFEYGKIQKVNDETLETAINILKQYYELNPLIIIKINKNQKMVGVDLFTYGIFTFTVSNGYLYVYV